MTVEIIALFDRDLKKLSEEIGLYPDEKQIWSVKDGTTNSAGNLCWHIIGNLNHFIGAVLGKTGYVRNRDEEFSIKNIPASTLVSELEKTNAIIAATLKKLPEPELDLTFPVNVFGTPMSTKYFLLHLYGHLNYHLGQVNYHRRIIDNR